MTAGYVAFWTETCDDCLASEPYVTVGSGDLSAQACAKFDLLTGRKRIYGTDCQKASLFVVNT